MSTPSADTRRVALVTGAASGIGKATVELFASRGHAVVAVDVSERGLESLNRLDGVVTVVGSVTEEQVNKAAVDAALEHFGRLDTAVLNAGTGGTPPLESPRAIENADRIIGVNLRGPIHGLRAAIPALRASQGSAVFTASVAGLRGDPGNWAYNATKGALVNLVRAFAIDYAGVGVRINVGRP